MNSRDGTTLAAPEAHLDGIYTTVLRASIHGTYDEDEEEEAYADLRLILGAIVTLFTAVAVDTLCALIGRPQSIVSQTIDDLHSIIDVPGGREEPLRLHHDSFRNFLLDGNRCQEHRLCVSEGDAHARLSKRCVDVMSQDLKEDICHVSRPGVLVDEVHEDHLQQHLSAEIRYSCLYWIPHTAQVVRVSKELLDHNGILEFLRQHILHWVEAMSWMGKISDAIVAMTTLERLCEVSLHHMNFLRPIRIHSHAPCHRI
jgi:hypothetical protein